MLAIERDNPSLKGVLPKDYVHPRLDKERLGQLIDMVGNIGLGYKANRSKDILGRVYEYFLSQFASAEGKKGGQFYTPRCVVRVLVEMLAPLQGDGRPPKYEDIPGFCKSATIEEIRKHGYILTPGRYVGAAPQEEDDEFFEDKMKRLVAQLREQQAEAARLDAAIAKNLEELGFWEEAP